MSSVFRRWFLHDPEKILYFTRCVWSPLKIARCRNPVTRSGIELVQV